MPNTIILCRPTTRKESLHVTISSVLLIMSSVPLLALAFKYPLLATDTLYLPQASLPATVQFSTHRQSVVWQYTNDYFLVGDTIYEYGGSIAMTGWDIDGTDQNNLLINQLVIDNASPLFAFWNYIRAHPLWLPIDATDKQHHDETISLDRRFASQDRLVCVDPGTTGCRKWFYWALYRQYIFRLHISSDNEPIDVSTMTELIKQLDQHVQQRVLSGRYR